MQRRDQKPEFSFKQRLLIAFVPPLAALLIRLLGSTLRYRDITDPGVTPGNLQPGPAIFAFWHRSLLLSAYRFRNQHIAILISRYFDGELIARTVERLGYLAVRGSSSRAGAAGLRGLERAYHQGHICAITADGPRGPAMLAKSGAVQLAQLTGATNVGIFYVLPARAWTLRSWDKFLIAKPFSRVVVSWPSPVAADLPSVQAALNRAVHLAVQTLWVT